jgi:N-acetyl sugar amidotransferase
MSTRPRQSFDTKGRCSACVWALEKKKLNWSERKKDLIKLLNKHRKKDGSFDCLVPVSGGKDSSYVAYNLKHKYNMNPLCVTVKPALAIELGNENLNSFIKSGYTLLSIDPNYLGMQKLNKQGFIEMGFPYYGWLCAIFSAVVRVADDMNISLVFYGEDGEVEYGGTPETKKNPIFGVDYMKKIYLEKGYEKVIKKSKLSFKESYYFKFPLSKSKKLKFTHWSYFENWDPYRNYLVAKKYCGLKESLSTNSGTFTNFSQNDQKFYALHTYMMYLKFGFGRANQDASIEIRRGAMSREQGKNLVKLYDGQFPNMFLDDYLNYYKMSKNQFENVLNKWANKKLFKKSNDGLWRPRFEIL